MSKARPKRGSTAWEAELKFHLPSADPGIVFQGTAQIAGKRLHRLPAAQAETLALGAMTELIAPVASRYTVLCAETASAQANIACLTLRSPRRGLRIATATVQLDATPAQRTESEHYALLRRTAAVAGRAAVESAASADLLRRVVFADHAATIAHLLLTNPPEPQDDVVTAATNLRRDIDDHYPDQRWIRVAEVISTLEKRRTPEQIEAMFTDLAKWAELHDPPLSESLKHAVTRKEYAQDPASEIAPEPDPAARTPSKDRHS